MKQERLSSESLSYYRAAKLLILEEPLVETLEASTVTGLVLCHLVNGVVDSVISELLCPAGDGELALAGSALGLGPLLDIGLGIPYNLAQQLGELGCVLCLLESVALEGLGDLGIALPLCPAAHCEIHSHFAALAVEMVVKTLHNFLILNLSITKLVLAGPLETFALHFYELV